MKQEGVLKAAFARELKRQLPHYEVLFYATAGAPDRTIVGDGRQTNWECKHLVPSMSTQGLQELTCMRLAVQGHCKYVLWSESRGMKRTLIVEPRIVYAWLRHEGALRPEAVTEGFDHAWLVQQVRKAHESCVR